MQVRFIISGLGLLIPKTSIGFNIASGAYISFRSGQGQPTTRILSIADAFSLGKSGSVIGGHAKTQWIDVDVKDNEWLTDITEFSGVEGEILISGTFINHGRVNVEFNIYKDGQKTNLLKKFRIHAEGGQTADTKVIGEIKKMPVYKKVIDD